MQGVRGTATEEGGEGKRSYRGGDWGEARGGVGGAGQPLRQRCEDATSKQTSRFQVSNLLDLLPNVESVQSVRNWTFHSVSLVKFCSSPDKVWSNWGDSPYECRARAYHPGNTQASPVFLDSLMLLPPTPASLPPIPHP